MSVDKLQEEVTNKKVHTNQYGLFFIRIIQIIFLNYIPTVK